MGSLQHRANVIIMGQLAEKLEEAFEETTDPEVLSGARHKIKKALLKQFDGCSPVQRDELEFILKRL